MLMSGHAPLYIAGFVLILSCQASLRRGAPSIYEDIAAWAQENASFSYWKGIDRRARSAIGSCGGFAHGAILKARRLDVTGRIEREPRLQRAGWFDQGVGRILRKEACDIRSIDVEYIDNLDPGVLVSYEMTCHLKKAGLVRFGTYFEPPGRMRVQRIERER